MTDLPPRLFVSYASADRARVESIVATIGAAGIAVWVDRSGIPGGASYGPEIVRAIRESAALLLMCSPAAYASRNVPNEVALAWKHGRPIVPMLLEPADVPDELAYWLDSAQWIEVLDRQEHLWLPALLRALGRHGISAAPVVAARADKGTLPSPDSALLGREHEVIAITALLGTQQLVTLTGPGGIGKTRLAIDVAMNAAGRFPDGVTFVDLAPLTDQALVRESVARALGARDLSGTALRAQIAALCAGKRLLVVFDNFEHLLDAAPAVAELLADAPSAHALVTSRAPLRLRAEHEVPLAPLAISPAVALFAQRAARAKPGFGLTPDNRDAVEQICLRLDGLPLAIELAAARLKLLSPQNLLARLDHPLPLLTGGARDLPARQQTLHDTIAWSYDLLDGSAQALFRRLAVFANGFTLEAAEAVARAAGDLDVFDGLAALVDSSLVRPEDAIDPPRFRMLETIREFARDRLVDSGEEPVTREAHARWCHALALSIGEELEKLSGQRPFIERLDQELDNVRTAIAWFLDHGDLVPVLEIVGLSGEYLYQRPLWREVHAWLRRALAQTPSEPSIPLVNGLIVYVYALENAGQLPEARRVAQSALDLARQMGDPYCMGRAHHTVGVAWEWSGDGDRAAAEYRAGTPYFRQAGHDLWAAFMDVELASRLVWAGELGEAGSLLEQSLRTFRDAAYEWGIAVTHLILAYRCMELNELAPAVGHFATCLAMAREQRDDRTRLGAAVGLAGVALRDGRAALGAHLLGAVDAAREPTGIAHLAGSMQLVRVEKLLRGALGDDSFDHAFAAGRTAGWEAPAADVARAYGNELRSIAD